MGGGEPNAAVSGKPNGRLSRSVSSSSHDSGAEPAAGRTRACRRAHVGRVNLPAPRGPCEMQPQKATRLRAERFCLLVSLGGLSSSCPTSIAPRSMVVAERSAQRLATKFTRLSDRYLCSSTQPTKITSRSSRRKLATIQRQNSTRLDAIRPFSYFDEFLLQASF